MRENAVHVKKWFADQVHCDQIQHKKVDISSMKQTSQCTEAKTDEKISVTSIIKCLCLHSFAL